MSNVITDSIEMSDTTKQTFERLEFDISPSTSNSEDSLIDSNDGCVITQEYFDKICKEFEDMNYLELTKTCRHLKTNRDDLIHAKRTADQFIEMKNRLNDTDNDDLASAIMEANAETEAGTDTIETFLASYDDSMDKLDKLIERAEELIRKFDEQEKTTSFLTDNMLSVLNKNMARLEKSNDPSLKNIKIFYKVLHEIFTNRTSTTFLVEKVKDQKIIVRRLRDSISKDKSGSAITTTQKMVGGTFSNIFNATQLEAIEAYLQKLFNDDDLVFYLQYALAHFYEHEKVYGKYGKHKWVEVMFMNIVDLCIETYDLEGGKEYYDQQLLKLKDAVQEILK